MVCVFVWVYLDTELLVCTLDFLRGGPRVPHSSHLIPVPRPVCLACPRLGPFLRCAGPLVVGPPPAGACYGVVAGGPCLLLVSPPVQRSFSLREFPVLVCAVAPVLRAPPLWSHHAPPPRPHTLYSICRGPCRRTAEPVARCLVTASTWGVTADGSPVPYHAFVLLMPLFVGHWLAPDCQYLGPGHLSGRV